MDIGVSPPKYANGFARPLTAHCEVKHSAAAIMETRQAIKRLVARRHLMQAFRIEDTNILKATKGISEPLPRIKDPECFSAAR